MRYVYAVAVLAFSLGLAGCDGARLPKHAIPGSPETTEPLQQRDLWETQK